MLELQLHQDPYLVPNLDVAVDLDIEVDIAVDVDLDQDIKLERRRP